jgi:ribonuclease HI
MDYNYTVYVDGGCHVHKDGEMYGSYKIINRKGKERIKRFDLGIGTNNQAEILSMIEVLNDIHKTIIDAGKKLADFSVLMYTDSMLIQQQAIGSWRVRDQHLVPLHETLSFLVKEFKVVDIAWVSRDKIVEVLGH